MSKKCINCGAELDDDQLFCDDCGTKQVIEPQPKSKKEKKSKSVPQQTTISESDKQAIIQAEADAKARLEAKKVEKAKKQEERKNNPKHLAVASLILGIISYLSIVTIIIPIATSILGIIWGVKGRKSEKKKIAIAGIVLNIGFIVLFIIILILGVL